EHAGEQGTNYRPEQGDVRHVALHLAPGAGKRGDVRALQGGPRPQGPLGALCHAAANPRRLRAGGWATDRRPLCSEDAETASEPAPEHYRGTRNGSNFELTARQHKLGGRDSRARFRLGIQGCKRPLPVARSDALHAAAEIYSWTRD